MSYKTKFKPINIDKYKGNPNNIICRSLWERFIAKYFDKNEQIEWWSSEELMIPYLLPNGEEHRYFPDFIMKLKNSDKIHVIEIKPEHEMRPPIHKKGKKREKLLYEMQTYIKNQSKWKYAKQFCDKHNMEFLIWGESELKKLGYRGIK